MKFMKLSVGMLFLALILTAACLEQSEDTGVQHRSTESGVEGYGGSAPDGPFEDTTYLSVDKWGGFSGESSQYYIYEDSSKRYPNSISVHGKSGEDSLVLNLYPNRVLPLEGDYSLDIGVERQFKDQLHANIDGKRYVSIDGYISIEKVSDKLIYGSFKAVLGQVNGADQGEVLEVSGTFESQWFLNCNVVAEVPEHAPEDQPRVYIADKQFDSEFCAKMQEELGK